MDTFDYTLFDVTKEAGSHLGAIYTHLSVTAPTKPESSWWRMKAWAMKSFPTSMHFTHRDEMKRAIALINTEIEFLNTTYGEQLDLLRQKENADKLQKIQDTKDLPFEYEGIRLDPELKNKVYETARNLRTLYTHLAVSSPTTVEEHWWMLKLSEMAHFPINIGLRSEEIMTALITMMQTEDNFLTTTYHDQLAALDNSIVASLATQRRNT
ncbi:hypothetical protein CMUST_15630 (plasmid) [Corynebacterium mustelae]|uniref:Uncharacterized protein n=1 Tax=Corynebacterium mustelae TaxID=571915 RepID=A0A0G3H3T8_9CORY|nr:hypothetical protein [Corynebacterium mustelae]AKK07415.1 hypothetical protein CMUST_15630 [Corynebacterium mustelae]